MEDRKEFLIKIYEQMFNDIDRHHKIVWETMSVLIGAFAVLAFIEKKIISLDMATALIILLACWVLTHVFDSNYWYNRNMVIIANIERQFLEVDDLKFIHYYFGKHRSANFVQTSLKIQIYFCGAVILLYLIYHFINSLYPGFGSPLNWANLDLEKLIPYLSLLFGILIVRKIYNQRIENYKEFIRNSPGIKVDTKGIKYGDGHPSE